MTRASLLLALAVGCASAQDGRVRFANAPPVQRVDDRRDVPDKPERRVFMRAIYHLEGSVAGPLERKLELPRAKRALGVNAHDEVPDSTWFTNRIGARTITLDELRAAPGGVGSPEPHTPWTIESSKVGGQSVGFIISDARGERWLLKFDRVGYPELETAAHAIVCKLLWAVGYNVTEDYVVYFDRDDLVLGPHAVTKDVFGRERRLDAAGVERRLAEVAWTPGRPIRALASRMLAGEPLGGHPAEGVRADDPNDRIAHERRRDLRGAQPLFAWLDHEDVHEGNFLDMWVEDRGRRYVKHYLIDFGMSLGVMPSMSRNLRRSTEYYIDVDGILGSLVTLGIARRDWERREDSPLLGVGAFDVATFDPGAWKPTTPAYTPFIVADRFDKFWGAKLVMRFTPAQLQVAIDAARFSDPRAARYMLDTLVARQRAIGRYWFARVAPLDRFAFDGDALCFDDLALAYGFVSAGSYNVTSYDARGRELGASQRVSATHAGHACARIALERARDGYTIVRIEVTRSEFRGALFVHVARHPDTNAPRVIGIWRT